MKEEELLRALDDAAYRLFSAYRALAAICETDGNADRNKARDNAWDAYLVATKVRNEYKAREVKP